MISQSADFYGAMDGASKFVRGDAVAAVIIVVVNIVGGLTIGILQQGMSPGLAAQTYTLLTVGEGLVAQIPALIVSTATGMIVTRAASENDLGAEMAGQLLNSHRAVGTAGGILLALGLVPGLPHLAFLVLGAGVAGLQAIATAQCLFHARGYDAVSVADLTEALGINPPSFYAAFGSKAGLYARTLGHYTETKGVPLAELLRPSRPVAEALAAVLAGLPRLPVPPTAPPPVVLRTPAVRPVGGHRLLVIGCSTGEEAYSLAILLDEGARNLGVEPSFKVFATNTPL